MANKINRTGEKKMMKCGLEAEIIRYENANDIDVRFEDGTVVKHKHYDSFLKGRLTHPEHTKLQSRLGEKRIMNCGMEAEIIRYGSSKDIDVQFEDGSTVEHREYYQFTKGTIAHPNFRVVPESRVGKIREMNCGMTAEIIQYRNATDINVRFEDGTVIEHRRYDNFLKGKITHPDFKVSPSERIGEKRKMNYGMEAEIIRYGNANDIDVRFEDGTVVKHKHYDSFLKGRLTHPEHTKLQSRLGEKRIMNCGMEAEIIRYGSSNDIDVKFEDGTTVEHRQYAWFLKGRIVAHPELKKYQNRIGEKE